MRDLIEGFLRRLSESCPAIAEMSEGKEGRVAFAVCAIAEEDATNVINKRDAVLFIACPRDSDFCPAKS